jgi:hypothetical protein
MNNQFSDLPDLFWCAMLANQDYQVCLDLLKTK